MPKTTETDRPVRNQWTPPDKDPTFNLLLGKNGEASIVRCKGSPRTLPPFQIDRDTLKKQNATLRNQLQEIAASVNLEDEEELRQSIIALAASGMTAFEKLFPDYVRSEVRALLGDRPKYHIELDGQRIGLHYIEISGTGVGFPWELLNIADRAEDGENAFVGSSSVVIRNIEYNDCDIERRWVLPATRPLRIGGLLNDELVAVKKDEARFLERLAADGRCKLERLIVKTKIKNAWGRSKEVFDFLAEDHPIDHFACHAWIDENAFGDSEIVLARDLRLKLQYMESCHGFRLPNNPLIIFNACDGGSMSSTHVEGFAHKFLEAGARSILTTECEVPSDSAAEFVRHFYKHFLEGKDLSESLWLARRHLLQINGDPAALIYSSYGEPYLTMSVEQSSKSSG